MLHVWCWELSRILSILVPYFLVRPAKLQLRKCKLPFWPKGPSDTWGISQASSLLRSNYHQCHQCIRCLQATNPRDGAEGQETRHKSRGQALEWAKHAHSLLRCPPGIWRWRRLDAKRFQSSGSYHQDPDDWTDSREAAKWGTKANSPIAAPLHPLQTWNQKCSLAPAIDALVRFRRCRMLAHDWRRCCAKELARLMA